ncbi:TIGR00282 family metallophosphoesterase [Halodesulfovibrio sp.]|jgi:metallophosphoesterase (TIGR00282 family)|uniref:TIGR00282 family metallophosphoesterase n=1 Tax=Halodesulfovibrio sp. TaxID=1912772 RepID=UPI0025FF3227|nr:TIGR00282 family metallophosphoesterase [Halodesulfovibrio sp.]MCT4535690.1 TIGR00282 family metallophosphoesterase [Halodesulfovibrio sp.]
MRILFFGDIVGKPGRLILRKRLASIKEEKKADLVIANGENASGGIGLSGDTMRELFNAGIDILTSGNHIWKHKEMYNLLNTEPRLIRPANYPHGAPGHGLVIHELDSGSKIAVMNLLGRTFMDDIDCPFKKVDELLASIPDDVRIRIIDFHAEATSEKKALSFYVDGKVSGVIGTHTHVQTADAMILEKGTGYLTDAGMCGVEESCLGMEPKVIIERFMTGLPQRFKVAKGTPHINGLYLDIDDESGLCTDIELIRE